MKYLLGQRVIYGGTEICKVCPPPRLRQPARPGLGQPAGSDEIWIMRAAGYEARVALHNVQPLPNGQL